MSRILPQETLVFPAGSSRFFGNKPLREVHEIAADPNTAGVELLSLVRTCPRIVIENSVLPLLMVEEESLWRQITGFARRAIAEEDLAGVVSQFDSPLLEAFTASFRIKPPSGIQGNLWCVRSHQTARRLIREVSSCSDPLAERLPKALELSRQVALIVAYAAGDQKSLLIDAFDRLVLAEETERHLSLAKELLARR